MAMTRTHRLLAVVTCLLVSIPCVSQVSFEWSSGFAKRPSRDAASALPLLGNDARLRPLRSARRLVGGSDHDRPDRRGAVAVVRGRIDHDPMTEAAVAIEAA